MFQAFVPMMIIQNMSTQTNSVTNQVISRNLELRQCKDQQKRDSDLPRPLVCLFAWMMAKRRHINKYGDFYLDRGLDVLNIQIHPDQGFLPVRAQACAQQVLDYIDHRSVTVGDSPILVHGFSIGAYLYGEVLLKLAAFSERYEHITNNIAGEIFDSGVDFEGIPYGFSKALTANRRLQKILQTSIEKYLKVTYQHTTK